MGSWRAFSFDSVRHESIAAALEREGLKWTECAHITATGSLAEAVLDSGAQSLAIATLIDAIVMGGLSDGRRIACEEFPQGVDSRGLLRDDFVNNLNDWSGRVAGRRVWMSVEMQDSIRRMLSTGGYPSAVQKVLRHSRRDLIASVQQMISNGVRPELLDCDEELARAATDIWQGLEREFPDLASMRDDIWMDPKVFAAGTTKKAVDLRRRIEVVLARAFGEITGPRTLVHHGFYFYSAPQWALFQLLREMPNINQVFIVHDDGESQVFETWRWYFTPKWLMPTPQLQPLNQDFRPAAAAFIGALKGQVVDPGALARELEIVEFRNPAQFIGHWKQFTNISGDVTVADKTTKSVAKGGRPDPMVFAADADSIDKYVERLAGFAQGGAVDLALLPIGSYLRGLHNCIQLSSKDEIRVVLKAEDVIDILSSGYLILDDGTQADRRLVNVFRQASAYFEGCNIADEWIGRGTALYRLLAEEAATSAARKHGEDDLSRMSNVVANPVRLAPWADVALEDVEALVRSMRAIVRFATEIASTERVKLRRHVATLRAEVLRGLSHLNDATRKRIQSLMDGMTIGVDTEIAVDDLVEVVNLLLSESARFGDQRLRFPSWKTRQLNYLDALAFKRHNASVHVANLADTNFPTVTESVVWPYSLDDLRSNPDALSPVALEIMETREATASASSLYLFFLALDGVSAGHKVLLSYVRDDGRETRNPSTVLTLLSTPGHRPTPAIIARAGGLSMSKPKSSVVGDAVKKRRLPKPPRSSGATVSTAISKIPAVAAASSLACPRRFALQWATGPSPSYQSEHHHQILFGNLLRRLSAKATLVTDLWRHVTPGQRESSKRNAVLASTKGAGARKEWLFTLGGSGRGQDPISHAYQESYGGTPVDDAAIAPNANVYLPVAGHDVTSDVCISCPVRARCATWVAEE
jgi:hypothetical protein